MDTNTNGNAKAIGKVKVKLLKDHSHDGREFKAGQKIELPEDVAEFLLDLRDGEGKPAPGCELAGE